MNEKLLLLSKYLEEERFFIVTMTPTELYVNLPSGDDREFIIRNADNTAVVLCGNNKIDLADPQSFPLILNTIRYCKDIDGAVKVRWQKCARCPAENYS